MPSLCPLSPREAKMMKRLVQMGCLHAGVERLTVIVGIASVTQACRIIATPFLRAAQRYDRG